MPRLLITKNQNGIVVIGGAVGSISSPARTVDLSVQELESVRDSLTELETLGIISWSVREIPTANPEADGAVFSQVTDAALHTPAFAHYFMSTNAIATTIAVQGTFVKIAGSTTAGPYVANFTLTDNRAKYTGSRSAYFKVSATLSFNSGNNQTVTMRVAVNGITQISSESHTTTSGSGRSENAKLQTVVQLTNVGTDYIEVWITNSTATNAITVTDLSVIAELLN